MIMWALHFSTVVQLPLSPIVKGKSSTGEVRTRSIVHCSGSWAAQKPSFSESSACALPLLTLSVEFPWDSCTTVSHSGNIDFAKFSYIAKGGSFFAIRYISMSHDHEPGAVSMIMQACACLPVRMLRSPGSHICLSVCFPGSPICLGHPFAWVIHLLGSPICIIGQRSYCIMIICSHAHACVSWSRPAHGIIRKAVAGPHEACMYKLEPSGSRHHL